jgi:general secretion pathway protein F
MADPSTGALTLVDLVALSEEMSALVRSGIPLERGLLNLGRDIPGQLGRTTRRLAERLHRGEDLSTALAAEQGTFPRDYEMVVQAGLRTGRLSLALEGVAVAARRLAELRRALGLAIVYPLTVFLLAYGLFVLFVVRLAPELQQAYAGFNLAPHWLLDSLVWLGTSAGTWGPILPIALLALGLLWWRESGRALLVNPTRAARVLGWVPWIGKLIRYSHGAMFAEVLALLLEHGTPLDDALQLAGEASGDTDTLTCARRLADSVRQGQPLARSSAGLPPILGWLLATQPQQELLVTAARHAAASYAWQAAHQAEKIRLLFPVVVTLCAAGLVTMIYALMLYVPWSQLLRSLAGP